MTKTKGKIIVVKVRADIFRRKYSFYTIILRIKPTEMVDLCFQFLIFINHSLQIINIFIVFYAVEGTLLLDRNYGLTLFASAETINTH